MAILRVGTSGYAYKPWKGPFYPEKLPDAEMLRFYSTQFRTVEINHSFYRMPVESMIQKWAQQVPPGFHFALKANQQITHIRKLRGVEETLRRFLEVASILQEGDRLGPVLIQLPPTFKADLPALDAFLKLRPRAFRFAFEVRHPSWHTPETLALLRAHQTALCIAETGQPLAPAPATSGKPKARKSKRATSRDAVAQASAGFPAAESTATAASDSTPPALSDPQMLTADFAYVRLRKEDYSAKEIAAWRVQCDAWLAQGRDVYVYFKHEDEGKAPALARNLLAAS